MVRIEYDLGASSYTLKWLLSDKRWHRGFKFQPLQTKRDWFIARHKRINNWNKHTMGTE